MTGHIFLPASRYAYPAIIPTVIVLNTGWLEIFRTIRGWFRLKEYVLYVIYSAAFLSLDLLALLSIIKFFARR